MGGRCGVAHEYSNVEHHSWVESLVHLPSLVIPVAVRISSSTMRCVSGGLIKSNTRRMTTGRSSSPFRSSSCSVGRWAADHAAV